MLKGYKEQLGQKNSKPKLFFIVNKNIFIACIKNLIHLRDNSFENSKNVSYK